MLNLVPMIRSIFPYMFTVPFFIAGCVATVFGLNGLFNGIQSSKWPSTSGLVLESKVDRRTDSDGDVSYKANIKYEYKVEEGTHHSRRIMFGDFGSNISSRARKFVDKYPVGMEVDVYYHPQKPELAAIEPGLKMAAFMLPIFGLVFCAAGIVGFIIITKKMRR